VPWLQEGGQDRLAGSASMDGFVAQLAVLAGGWGWQAFGTSKHFNITLLTLRCWN